jgi:hypothetical protein
MFTRRAKPIRITSVRITSFRISGVLLYFIISMFFDKFNGFRDNLTMQVFQKSPNNQQSILRDVTQRKLIASYRRFGTNFRSKIQGQEVKIYPETSETNYQSTLCNIPEDRRSRLHRGGSPKSRNQQCPSEHTHCHNLQDKRNYRLLLRSVEIGLVFCFGRSALFQKAFEAYSKHTARVHLY